MSSTWTSTSTLLDARAIGRGAADDPDRRTPTAPADRNRGRPQRRPPTRPAGRRWRRHHRGGRGVARRARACSPTRPAPTRWNGHAAPAQPDPATYIGKGKAEELAELAEMLDIDLVVFDVELTPAQQRNLEKLFKRDVVDREAVILDIFAQHAHSQAGMLQVELAAAPLPPAPPAGHGACSCPGRVAASVPGSVARRDQARGRPAPHPGPHRQAGTRARRRRPRTGQTQRKARRRHRDAAGGPRRATPTRASRRCSTS